MILTLWILLLLISCLLFLYRSTQLPAALRQLPRISLVTNFYFFLNYPVLKAVQHAYWPLLFKYKAMVTMYLGKWWVVLSDKDDVNQILADQTLGMKIGFESLSSHALILEYMGTNVVFSQGEEWRKHRKVVNPAFRRKIQPELFSMCVQRLVDQLKFGLDDTTKCSYKYTRSDDGIVIDVHDPLTSMTLDTLGLHVFNYDFDATNNPQGDYTRTYHTAAEGVSNSLYFFFPILEKLNLKSRNKDKLAVLKFRNLIADLVAKRRQDKIKREDPMSLIIEGADKLDENGRTTLTDRELINNIVVMFAAGHDTTANTLSFTLYHLATNLDIQRRLRQEIIDVLNSATPTTERTKSPSCEQLHEMKFMDAVIKESMRLTPTLFQLRRCLAKDYSLKDGTTLPKHTLVLLQTYSTMNDPQYWKNPELFDPDRFMKNATPIHKLENFYGFGGGFRQCVGIQMSMIEQKMCLALLLLNFKFELPQDSIHRKYLVTSKDSICRPIDLKLKITRVYGCDY